MINWKTFGQQQQQPSKPRQMFPLGTDTGEVTLSDTSIPKAYASPEDIDAKMLSAKLNNMSMEERTQGIHELHGVADTSKMETPELLKSRLQEMTDIANNSFSINDTIAYRKALQMSKEYVERMKLLCLRADYYDSQKAASRLISFFTYKQELFGDAPLGRDITLADFDDGDMEGMRTAMVQILQQRDRAGRAVIMMTTGKLIQYDTKTCLRVMYYISMVTLRDEEVQKQGVVFVVYTLGQKFFVSDRPKKFVQSLWFLPHRTVALHMCVESKLMSIAARIMSQAMESYQLCRFRCHNGSYLEIVYHLMTFGIPKQVIPIDMNNGGELDVQPHLSWLERVQNMEQSARAAGGRQKVRRQQEEEESCQQLRCHHHENDNNSIRSDNCTSTSSNNPTIHEEIAVPGPMDIIVGRGSSSRSSPGYLRMRNLVYEQREEYEKADKSGKTKLTKAILQESLQMGCRFVKLTPEGYIKCNDVQSREKISHTFRNMRKTTSIIVREKASKRCFPGEQVALATLNVG